MIMEEDLERFFHLQKIYNVPFNPSFMSLFLYIILEYNFKKNYLI